MSPEENKGGDIYCFAVKKTSFGEALTSLPVNLEGLPQVSIVSFIL